MMEFFGVSSKVHLSGRGRILVYIGSIYVQCTSDMSQVEMMSLASFIYDEKNGCFQSFLQYEYHSNMLFKLSLKMSLLYFYSLPFLSGDQIFPSSEPVAYLMYLQRYTTIEKV